MGSIISLSTIQTALELGVIYSLVALALFLSLSLIHIFIAELKDVRKRYAQPRLTEIVCEEDVPDLELDLETPDYPVHLFLSQEGYLKKITPQSLRMSGEQKYKEGDAGFMQWEANNRDELMVFTDRQQCYKLWLSDCPDGKASLLGEYLPSKLAMEPGRCV